MLISVTSNLPYNTLLRNCQRGFYAMKENIFGGKIRELRKAKGLTLHQFAKEIGTSASYLSEIERGLKVPGGEFFLTLKQKFHISLDAIFSDNTSTIVAEPPSPYIASVTKIMLTMDEESQKDIQRYTEKEKRLTDLMKDKQETKAG